MLLRQVSKRSITSSPIPPPAPRPPRLVLHQLTDLRQSFDHPDVPDASLVKRLNERPVQARVVYSAGFSVRTPTDRERSGRNGTRQIMADLVVLVRRSGRPITSCSRWRPENLNVCAETYVQALGLYWVRNHQTSTYMQEYMSRTSGWRPAIRSILWPHSCTR